MIAARDDTNTYRVIPLHAWVMNHVDYITASPQPSRLDGDEFVIGNRVVTSTVLTLIRRKWIIWVWRKNVRAPVPMSPTWKRRSNGDEGSFILAPAGWQALTPAMRMLGASFNPQL